MFLGFAWIICDVCSPSQDEFGKSRDGEETIHGAPGQTNDHSLGIHRIKGQNIKETHYIYHKIQV